MSVQINQYLIFGAKLNYEDYKDFERFERFCDSAFDDQMNPAGLHCIYDGMNGKYIYIGRCIKKSENHEFMDSFQVHVFSEDMKEMTRKLVLSELSIDEPMAMHFVTHYR